jgi:hypothetical protein
MQQRLTRRECDSLGRREMQQEIGHLRDSRVHILCPRGGRVDTLRRVKEAPMLVFIACMPAEAPSMLVP